MNYFGTSLNEHGHYLWDLHEDRMENCGINFKHLPFHPEELTNNLLKGEVVFYQCTGYTVIGIAGSCVDERPRTKSIFWVLEKISFDEMKERILNNPIAKKIIEKMSFEIEWDNS
ncbi:unnamed protein product [marine sediment metagenome]|uniref:Uncharacterized protein n=1 Tax=marine sediment metagenome TaxID=412755 RepID=X1B308_9ZZZZ